MKTIIKFFLIVALGTLILSSCTKKKTTLPESNDPIFTAEGAFGSEAFSLIAGDDNAYMYTMTSNVYGVEVVTGQLSNDNFALELGIYDGQIDKVTAEFENGMSLSPTFSERMTSPITTLSANYFSNNLYIQSIDWTIDGQNYGQGNIPIMNPGIFNVTADISYVDGSSASLTNDLILGYERSVNERLNYFEYPDTTVSVWVSDGNIPVQSVEWYLNGNLLPQMSDSIFIPIAADVNSIRAIITYTNGASRTKSILVDSAPNHSRSVEDFTLFEESSVNVLQDFNILVKLTSNGITYESELADNSSSTVQINSFVYYSLNSAGNKVYKVDADISCKVRSVIGATDIPLTFSTVFGFEVK